MQLTEEQLLAAYKRMRDIREFEDRLHEENTNGDIPGFIHLYSGEEAVAVGICENLTDKDYITSTHRGHGHCIAKGCDIHAMMLEIFGKDDGLCRGKGGSMHIADLDKGMLGANGIVGGGPPLAIGAALTAKTLKTGGVGLSFTGDGGSNQGLTFEAMNMAVVLKLPVIFVFENNGFGEGTGHDYAVGSKDIAGRAAGFGLPAVKVDGTDFFAVYEAAQTAIERARRGEGPSVIETITNRFYGHFEGDPGLIRSKEEVEFIKENKDPLKIFREKVKAPMVVRGMIGAGFSAAAQHSQSPYNVFAAVPGLKVVVPSSPYDVKGLLIQAIRDDDPVVFCEHKMLYDIKGEVPDDAYTIPFGVANYTREGTDVTIIALGLMVHRANEVADKLAKDGISVEVVDPRTISPLDEEGILESVASTGRVVIVDESAARCGFGHDVAALIAQKGFHYLKAPVELVTPPHTPVPFSPVLEKEWIPSVERIEQAVRKTLEA